MNRRQLLRLGALAVAAPKAMVASPPAHELLWRIVNLAELGFPYSGTVKIMMVSSTFRLAR